MASPDVLEGREVTNCFEDKDIFVDLHRACGRPVCAIIDARPKRFRSLCALFNYMKDESLHHRILHVQKGDCAAASKTRLKRLTVRRIFSVIEFFLFS